VVEGSGLRVPESRKHGRHRVGFVYALLKAWGFGCRCRLGMDSVLGGLGSNGQARGGSDSPEEWGFGLGC
jgi:hypothetical protein